MADAANDTPPFLTIEEVAGLLGIPVQTVEAVVRLLQIPRVKFFTVEQVAELIQLPVSTVFEYLGNKTIPGKVRLGRHVRVRSDAVLALGAGEVRVSRRS